MNILAFKLSLLEHDKSQSYYILEALLSYLSKRRGTIEVPS